MVNEIIQTQNEKYGIHLQNEFKQLNIEAGSRKEEGEMGSYCLVSMELVQDNEKALEMNGGDDCATL